MRKHKRHFVLITAVLFASSLLTVFVFGQNYSSEPADRTSKPPRPATAKTPLRAKRSATTYSTEDMAHTPAAKDPNTTTTSTRNPKVQRTRTVPREPGTPNRPESPDVPKSADCGGGYPTVAGGHFRSRLYPGRQYLCFNEDDDNGEFIWPGLCGIDLSYSWSGNLGRGEFAYWPYGYRYAWGDNAAYSDASGCYRANSAMESDPNTVNGIYTSYSTEDIRPPDYTPGQTSDANEPPPDAPVPDAAEKPESQTPKNK